ncbi:MAG TPA: rhodanese-like domain-containing protein [Rhodocyclaceae bacterium]|jgi:rhodanese-related sulfurtransferase
MFKSAHELVQEAKKSIKEGTSAEISQHIAVAGSLLIDVREPEEFVQGHIPGAINIPRGMLEFKISNEPTLQDLQRPVVLYCKSSGRSALAAVALKTMGFQNVISLTGGFDAWTAAGHDIAKPKDISFE